MIVKLTRVIKPKIEQWSIQLVKLKKQVSEIQSIKEMVASSKTHIEQLTKSVNEMKAHNVVINGKIKYFENENRFLKGRLNYLEQYNHKSNVIISVIPIYDIENVIELKKKIALPFSVNLAEDKRYQCHSSSTCFS